MDSTAENLQQTIRHRSDLDIINSISDMLIELNPMAQEKKIFHCFAQRVIDLIKLEQLDPIDFIQRNEQPIRVTKQKLLLLIANIYLGNHRKALLDTIRFQSLVSSIGGL